MDEDLAMRQAPMILPALNANGEKPEGERGQTLMKQHDIDSDNHAAGIVTSSIASLTQTGSLVCASRDMPDTGTSARRT